MNKPFSLLARFNPPPRSPPDLATPTRENKTGATSSPEGHHTNESDEIVDAELQDEEDTEATRKKTQELRDEKLKSDMFILKKLNAAFELFEEALEETGSANEVCSRLPF